MCFDLCHRSITAFVGLFVFYRLILSNIDYVHADPSGFILFPLVIHSFDLVISSVGIFSIRGTRDSGVKSPVEDPMAILQKGYSITIILAVLTFGLVRFHLPSEHVGVPHNSWLWLLFYLSFILKNIVIVFLSKIDQILEACNILPTVIIIIIIIIVYTDACFCWWLFELPVQSTRWLLYTEQAPSAWMNFALCGLVGIMTAYVFVWITKYYTDYKHEPVRTLALSSSTGHGTNIIAGVSLGLESTALPVIVISISIVSAFWLGQTSGLVDETGNPTGGLFGTAVATMGMLSTAAYVLTMDMFGPIADNAGGIVEMSQQVAILQLNFSIMLAESKGTLVLCF